MLTDLLHVLLGGMLVALGVLAAATADRIRGLRAQRTTPGTRRATPQIEVVEAEIIPMPSPRPRTRNTATGADDVITALVAAGYRKPMAAEAVWNCTAEERVTIETWTASALRRCAKGGQS